MGRIPTDEEIDAALGVSASQRESTEGAAPSAPSMPSDEEIDAALFGGKELGGKVGTVAEPANSTPVSALPPDPNYNPSDINPSRKGQTMRGVDALYGGALGIDERDLREPWTRPADEFGDFETDARILGVGPSGGKRIDSIGGVPVAPVAAFATGAVARAGSLGAAAIDAMNYGPRYGGSKPKPVPFNSTKFVHAVEDLGIFSTANVIDRIALRGGDVGLFTAAAAAAAPALMAAGLGPTLASTASMVIPSIMTMKQEADAAGHKIEPLDYGKSAAVLAVLGPVGARLGQYGTGAVSSLMKRELGTSTKRAIENSLLGGVFEGGNALYQGDPRWAEAMAAGVIGTNIGNAHGVLFSGRSQARLPKAVEEQFQIAADAAHQSKFGQPGAGPQLAPEVAGRINLSRAAADAINRQVPLGGEAPSSRGSGDVAALPEGDTRWVPLRTAEAMSAAEGAPARRPAPASRPPGPNTPTARSRMTPEGAQAEAAPGRRAAAPERAEKLAAITEPRLRKLIDVFGLPEAEAQRILAGVRRQRATPESRAQVSRELMDYYGIPKGYADQLASRTLTAKEAEIVLASKAEEALLHEAWDRGPAVFDEVLYRLDLMPDGYSKIFTAKNELRTPKEAEFLSRDVPTPDEIMQRARALDEQAAADVDAMESEMAREAQPEGLSPAEQVRKALQERGVVAGDGGQTAPPGSARRPPPKKVAGQRQEARKGTRRERLLALQREMEAARAARPGETVEQAAARLADEAAARERPVIEQAPARGQRRPEPEPPERVYEDVGESVRRLEAAKRGTPTYDEAARAGGATVPGRIETSPPRGDVRFRKTYGPTRPVRVSETGQIEPVAEVQGGGVPLDTAASTRSPEQAVRSIRDLATGQAERILGDQATQSPTGGREAKLDPKSERALEHLDRGLEDLKQDLKDRARRMGKGGGAVAGAAALATGATLAADEEERGAVASMAAMPLLAMLTRGRLKATANVHERALGDQVRAERMAAKAKMHAATVPLEELIRRDMKGLSGREAAKLGVDVNAKIEEIFGPEGMKGHKRWDLKQWDVFAGAVGHRIAKMGKSGEMLNRINQSFVSETKKRINAWGVKFKREDVRGLDTVPDKHFTPAEEDALNIVTDRAMAGSISDKEFDALPDNIRHRAAQRLMEETGRKIGTDPRVHKAARSSMLLEDAMYNQYMREGKRNIPGFAERLNSQDRYRPNPYRDAVYEPPASLEHTNYGEWVRRTRESQAWQDIMAQEFITTPEGKGVSLSDARSIVRIVLREMQQEMAAPPHMRNLYKKSANLHYSRALNLQSGRNWNNVAARERYLSGAAPAIEFAKHYGFNGQVSEALFKGIQAEGYNGTLARRYFETTTGQLNTTWTPDWMKRAIDEGNATVALKKLGGFPIGNIFQGALIPEQVGLKNYIKTLPEALDGWLGQSMFRFIPKAERDAIHRRHTERWLAEAGAVTANEHMRHMGAMHGVMPQVLDRYLRFNGGQGDRFQRNWAAVNGKADFDLKMDVYQAALKAKDQKAIEWGRKQFEEMFDDPVHMRMAWKGKEALKPGELKFLQWKRAELVTNRTQYRREPIDMPLLASVPITSPFYTLSSFAQRATAETYRQVTKSLKNPTAYRRVLLSWLGKGAPGLLALQLHRLRRHDEFDPEKDSVAQEILDAYVYMSTGPAVFSEIDRLNGRYGKKGSERILAHMGPMFNELLDMADAAQWSMDAQSIDPALKWLLTSTTPTVAGMQVPTKVPLTDKDLPKWIPGQGKSLVPTPKEVSKSLFPPTKKKKKPANKPKKRSG